MKFVLFYHSLISDWNHGNAHFLRGIVSELQNRGHQVEVYEPADGWSLTNLRQHEGHEPLDAIRRYYPHLPCHFYSLEHLELDSILEGADVVIAHEWNDPKLIAALGEHRDRVGGYRLFFHDTHHRGVTAPKEMEAYHLHDYDGVLAFGEILRELYLQQGWARNVWTWHEAADTRIFYPHDHPDEHEQRDLVWIGNWGDEERSDELRQFLIEPVRELQLKANVYGVRYPQQALAELSKAGLAFQGWLPNFRVPQIFAQSRCTVHIPRRPYREQLPGIPTIRVFEALACGIPLVCLHWEDSERLFTPGEDYLVVEQPHEMQEALQLILHDQDFARRMSQKGLQTIQNRHTCAHRVEELLQILTRLNAPAESLSALTLKG